jgi:glycosyltransferase involved in cell wall biosynthesis
MNSPLSAKTEPLKIAMVGPSYPFKGGIAQYTTNLYRNLTAHHDVLFVSFKRQYPTWLYPGQGDRDLTDTALQEFSGIPLIDSLNPLSWRRAVCEICKFKPELVIFPWWVMFWAPQFIYMIRAIRHRRKSCRVLFICHNVTAHEPSYLSRKLARLTLAQGDGYLVHSKKDRHDLELMLGQPRVTQVEHPSYELSDQRQCSREQAQHQLDISGKTLLFFGFLRPYKGLEVLLDAMPTILAEGQCTLVIAGEIWGDPRVYTEKIESLGITDHVRLVGEYIPQQDVATYFQACDLVVLPYLSATGSGVVKLDYSYNRPVVVSSVGSLPEAVLEGKTGYVVPAGNSAALANAIVTHLRREDRAVMEDTISTHVRQFSWEPVIQALEAL